MTKGILGAAIVAAACCATGCGGRVNSGPLSNAGDDGSDATSPAHVEAGPSATANATASADDANAPDEGADATNAPGDDADTNAAGNDGNAASPPGIDADATNAPGADAYAANPPGDDTDAADAADGGSPPNDSPGDVAADVSDVVPPAVTDDGAEAGCSAGQATSFAPPACGANGAAGDAACLCDGGACLVPTAVTAAGGGTCALLSNGSVSCWGDNEFGSLGNGTITSGSASPLPVQVTADVTAIAGGGYHTCALRSDGSVWCWGNYGEYVWPPDGGTADTITPLQVPGVSGATAMTAGDSVACALLSDHTVRCWGHNDVGQLGDGTMDDSPTAVTVSGLSGVTAIAAGSDMACALLLDGSVRCWGDNQSGQLGDGTTTDSSTPVQVSGLTGAVGLAAGWDHMCALLASGTVQCWGSNYFAQLSGAATGPDMCPQSIPCSKVPGPVPGLVGVTSIAAGQGFTCALLCDGSVRCWGMNLFGQLGNATYPGAQSCDGTPCSSAPTAVATVADALTLTCMGSHCCVLRPGGDIECWGSNNSGELGDGTTSGPADCDPYACSTIPVPVLW